MQLLPKRRLKRKKSRSNFNGPAICDAEDDHGYTDKVIATQRTPL